jgi:glycosyltransferase involved in cell wall biosynthesis
LKLRVAVITEMGQWSASTRHRATQHLSMLSTMFDTVDIFYPDDQPMRKTGRRGQVEYFAQHAVRYLRRHSELKRVLPGYDAAFVQRAAYPLGPSLVVRPIYNFSGRVILDLDDDVFSPHPALAEKGPVARWLYGPQQSLALVHRADSIVVSTEQLAAALPATKGAATILPTVPDPSDYAIAQHGPDNAIIGWVGTNGGLGYLDPLADVFRRMATEGLARLEVVSSVPWPLDPTSFRKWSLEGEDEVFARFAVGIMPLPDSPFTRAKAGFKLLQYMAAGVPVVASPVGVNRELIERSGAGYLADAPAEWETALRKLVADPVLRQRLGENGRRFVEVYANLESQAAVLAGAIRGTT